MKHPRRYRLTDPRIARLSPPVVDPSRDPDSPWHRDAITGWCAVCRGPVEDDSSVCSPLCLLAYEGRAAA